MNSTSSRKSLFSDKLLLALMALIVWLPISIPTNRSLAWSLAEFTAATLMIVWLIQFARGRRQVPDSFRRAWPFWTLFGAWCVYLALQITPLPPPVVEWLSPKAAWLHGLPFHPDKTNHWITISVDPHSTAVSLQKTLGYFLISVLTLLLASGHKQATWLAGALVLAGLVQVGIGILGISDNASLPSAEVDATFANRNHLANYLTFSIAAGLALLLATMNSSTPRNWRGTARRTIDWLMSGKMRLRIALLLMAVTIILTRSRMGNIAFFSSILIAGLVTLALVRQRKRGLVTLIGSIVAIDIIVFGSMVGIEKVAQRIEDTSLVAETRDEVARDTLTYWRDFTLTGSGLGSFYVTFPRYKQGDVSLFYKRAHNDFLQFAAEVGIFGTLLLACIVMFSISTAIQTLRRRHDPLAIGFAFSVVMSSVAVLIHATVEFNLQTFANAATYCVLLAMAWIATHLPRKRTTHPPEQVLPLNQRMSAVALIPMLIAYILWVSSTAIAGLISRSNEQFLAAWSEDGAISRAAVDAVMRRQVDAIRLQPGDAQAKILLARLAWWQLRAAGDRADPEKVYNQMLYALLDATRDNPGLASAWVSLATVRHFQRKYDGVFEAALANSAQLAPWEPHIQRAIARVGLGAWDDLATPDQRSLVTTTIARGLQSDDGTIRDLLANSGHEKEVCSLVEQERSSSCGSDSHTGEQQPEQAADTEPR